VLYRYTCEDTEECHAASLKGRLHDDGDPDSHGRMFGSPPSPPPATPL